MRKNKTICVALGDGIGPEIMRTTLKILQAAGAPLDFEEIELGEKIYLQGCSSGISPQAWEALNKNKVLLKGPITTPQGSGYKSLNVSLRKMLGLYANVRPCMAYSPFIKTQFPDMDVVIIRENEEDLYAGIEHQQTQEVIQCLKLISVPGCERIIRYAFEYAKQHHRKKITCMTKDNIMKLTDGLFHKMFNKISEEYPDIQTEHLIIDIGAALLAQSPEQFDVIVTLNLYGDILSDIASQIAGSVGLAGSANIGKNCAMFEAIHGSAPTLAEKNIANPSGLIHAAIQMLVYLGESSIAEKIQNAWLCTIEDGVHTADIYDPQSSLQLVGTLEFGAYLISRLGDKPQQLKPTHFYEKKISYFGSTPISDALKKNKELMGVDIFLSLKNPDIHELAEKLKILAGEYFQLVLITNRGVKVWPNPLEETLCTDHWRCRFKLIHSDKKLMLINELLNRLTQSHIEWIKLENLYHFDGQPGYSLGQGE